MPTWAIYGNAQRIGGGPPGAVSSYVGPGDINGSALAWWGLRAFSAATVGTKAINLRRDSDQATSDFSTLASGDLDVASIATFQGAANLFVTALYDKSGNSRDLLQATAANQPAFTLSGLGTLPIIQFNGSNSSMTAATNFGGQAQPFSISQVVLSQVTNPNTIAESLAGGNIELIANFGGADTFDFFAGTSFNVTFTHNVWHASQWLANGASTVVNVDGTTSNGNSGAGGFSGETSWIDLNQQVSFVERGIWGSDTSANFATMNSNQHTYWVF